MLLSKGSRGNDVKEIQRILHLCDDGIFGALTEEAVKEFQKANNLTVDGVVGDKTWALLHGNISLAKSKRTIKEIIVHCSATKEGVNYTTADIKKWHLQRGFSDIGYHYVVYLDGSVHAGRNVNIAGAHCTNHNTYSIGVCYVGGLDKNNKGKDTRTDNQKKSLVRLLTSLKQLYPKAKIIGHRDTSADKNHNGVIEPFEYIKECPCFNAIPEYANIK